MDLISVIIPVYNAEKYLDRCLEAVMNQTYTNLEIILVDDGSLDNCPDICDHWADKDKRIKVIHKANGGASAARNAGLRNAGGRYIGFVDADDWITPDFYEYLYDIAQKYGADIAMCDYARKTNQLTQGRKGQTVKEFSGNEIQEFFYRIHGEPSRYGVYICLYSAKVLEGIRFKEGLINEDVMFTYEAYQNAGKLVFSDRKKYLYYFNQNGVTSSKLCFKDFSLLNIWDEIVRLESGGQNKSYAELNRMRATFTLYAKAMIYGCDKDFDRAVLKEWQEELQRNKWYLLKGKILDIKRKLLLLYILAVG